jgi:hypothetical protein
MDSRDSRGKALASVNHSVAQIDKWEAANFKEDDVRKKVKVAKKQYEDALRRKFFNSSYGAHE